MRRSGPLIQLNGGLRAADRIADRAERSAAGSSVTATEQAAPGGDVAAGPYPDLARNEQIAAKLSEAADLLAARNGGPFRVAAYRRAAEALAQLDRDVADIEAEGGPKALDAIPSIGPSIAAAVTELLHTGRWRYLERLRAAASPAELFRSVPGIGPKLAQRLAASGLDSLQALEMAAHDGRLAAVRGIGRRRVAAIRSAVAELLGRVRSRARARREEPDVAMLLDVDRDYCDKVQADALPKIAPRRFNPGREAWLPVLHARRDSWEFTALYSNTARAHELGRVTDWVVIFFRRAGEDEMQRTVVTEHRAPLAGKRVVRGREADCRRYYGIAP
jgi:hypothetical protein